ncbi:hypothetical protein MMC18_000500 [Xylographa bjoerkii]|nr:hypothetical protein [Xylographa bjoerkii]
MASVGKIITALFSGSNENSVSLINLNLDFSLIKVEAPAEYTGLGSALSRHRRSNAEGGSLHQTARRQHRRLSRGIGSRTNKHNRLGALFEEIIPQTPNLIKAYGQRVSEISANPKINPHARATFVGSTQDGVFASHVGADGTSIWSAATSGTHAIAMHLLACMLARLFERNEAVAIFVHLVNERKKEIHSKSDDGRAQSFASQMAAQQNIQRPDLESWDASARAWLSSADEAKTVEQNQLRLIVDNIGLQVSSEVEFYASVLDSWFQAMTTLDKIISGEPHRISKGNVLVCISAWHIFPDLNVVGAASKIVEFKDSLVAESGKITIGLHSSNPDHNFGVQWSLALSHLRFYGDPVKVTKYSGFDGSRMTIDELRLVAFGSVLASWGSSGESIYAAAEFFIQLGNLVPKHKPGSVHNTAWMREDVTNFDDEDPLSLSGRWLRPLVAAAEYLLASSSVVRENAIMFITYGRRRGRLLLGQHDEVPPPLFGLSNPMFLFSLSNELYTDNCGQERAISLLRELATQCNLDASECVIRYPQGTSDTYYVEDQNFDIATARPLHSPQVVVPIKRERNGEPIDRTTHRRWTKSPHYMTKEECYRFGTDSYFSGIGKSVLQWVRPPRIFRQKDMMNKLTEKSHSRARSENKDSRHLHHISLSIDHNLVADNDIVSSDDELVYSDGLEVKQANGCFDNTCRSGRPLGSSTKGKSTSPIPPCDCYQETSGEIVATFHLFAGNPDKAALYTLEDEHVLMSQERFVKLNPTRLLPTLDIDTVLTRLRSPYLQVGKLLKYLNLLPREGSATPLDSIDKRRSSSCLYMRSLENLAAASEIYANIPQAAISMSVINQPLHQARWGGKPSYASIFSCIAMLESGVCNIDPEQLKSVMAVSSGNSIYVAAPLLQDPFHRDEDMEVKRIVGSLGRGGISMFIPPVPPRIRPLCPQRWKMVKHDLFDGSLKDQFSHTSIHLSFTQYEVPLVNGERGSEDAKAILLESLISVHEGGEWVGDLDVIGALSAVNLKRVPQPSNAVCSHLRNGTGKPMASLVSIDNWEELLDVSGDSNDSRIGIVRAHGNWHARLAATALSVQSGLRTLVLPPATEICWHCTGQPHSYSIPKQGQRLAFEKPQILIV